MVHLFIHLLLRANYKENTWQGRKIKRGQLITGLHKLSGNTGLSISQTRTCLSKLQTTGEITIEVTNKYSIVTICKYETYQSERTHDSKQNDKPLSIQVDKQDSKQDSNTLRKQEDKNKVFINKPLAEHFNGLPEIKIGSVIQYFKIAKQIDVTTEQVSGLWEIFKVQNLTGKKFYQEDDDVYSHFTNWVITKKIEKNGTIKPTPTNGVTRFNSGALELLEKGKAKYADIRRKQGD